MLQYVNSFSCTQNKQSGTVVIHFLQNEPVFSETEDGDADTVIREHEIASIILEEDCAQALVSSLTELFESTSEDDDEE